MINTKIQQFEGPLDLLLSLIEEQKLDITKIALAEVTEQFLKHIKQLELIFNPKLAGTGADLDATQLTLSDDQKTLYFVNKNDNQLWALNLTAGF
jgi:chromatin segregation and condensation protein Rec8/ScpA/Scc1 (kleisin family)